MANILDYRPDANHKPFAVGPNIRGTTRFGEQDYSADRNGGFGLNYVPGHRDHYL